MDYSKLEAFKAFTLYGNYKDAADALSITVPGLRKRLQILENELDTCLILKSKTLTHEGTLLKEALPILLETYAPTSLAQFKGQLATNLRITITPNLADIMGPLLIKLLEQPSRTSHTINFTNDPSFDDSDIYLTDNTLSLPSGVVQKRLGFYTFAACVARTHTLSHTPSDLLTAVHNSHWIAYNGQIFCRQSELDAALKRHGLTPAKGLLKINSPYAMKKLVKKGYGAAAVAFNKQHDKELIPLCENTLATKVPLHLIYCPEKMPQTFIQHITGIFKGPFNE